MFVSGKVITLRDLSNMKARTKSGPGNDLHAVIDDLRRDPSLSIEVFCDEEDNLLGIFYQDTAMRKAYASFSEMLFVDATHKLTNLRMPLYVFLVSDGNGQSEIVATCLVSSEQRAVVDKMLAIFKSNNPSWRNTRIILTDKDMTERMALQHAFPHVTLQLCLFHVLRSFCREVTTTAMAIRPAERYLVLDLLQKVAYTKSQETYEQLRQQLHETGLHRVVSYFETNWHLIRHEWANSFVTTSTFGNRTNNRLESINQKIKSVCSSFANLGDFFRELRTIIACLRVERDSVALNCISKVSVHAIGDSISAQYSRHLLPYPAGLVRTELHKTDSVCIEDGQVSGETTTCSECSCSFNQRMLLPCCHIFAMRRQQGLSVYDEMLSHTRWHTARYQVVHNAFCDVQTVPAAVANVTVSAMPVGPRRVPQTTHEKFRAARLVSMRLAEVASEACGTDYDDKMNQLRSLLQSWESHSVPTAIATTSVPTATATTSVLTATAISTTSVLTATATTSLPTATSTTSVPTATSTTSVPTATSTTSVPTATTTTSVPTATSTTSVPTATSTTSVPTATATTSVPTATATTSVVPDLPSIKLPSRMRKRGRPKGCEKTVVGLPKKKLRVGCVAFINLVPSRKEERMLSWFVSPNHVIVALAGSKLTKDMVETIPEQVDNACVSDNVCLATIRRFFTADAWKCVQSVVSAKQQSCTYVCNVCQCDIDDSHEPSINCDDCLSWVHLRCTASGKTTKKRQWFCVKCTAM